MPNRNWAKILTVTQDENLILPLTMTFEIEANHLVLSLFFHKMKSGSCCCFPLLLPIDEMVSFSLGFFLFPFFPSIALCCLSIRSNRASSSFFASLLSFLFFFLCFIFTSPTSCQLFLCPYKPFINPIPTFSVIFNHTIKRDH